MDFLAVLDRIVTELKTIAVVEQMPRMEGRNMFLMLTGAKKAQDSKPESKAEGKPESKLENKPESKPDIKQ